MYSPPLDFWAARVGFVSANRGSTATIRVISTSNHYDQSKARNPHRTSCLQRLGIAGDAAAQVKQTFAEYTERLI